MKGGRYLMGVNTYNREQVAELFQTNVETVSYLMEVGILKPIKIGKRYIFSEDMIQQFLKSYEGKNLQNKLEMMKSYDEVNHTSRYQNAKYY